MADFWSYYEPRDGQYLFERNLKGLLFFLHLVFKTLLCLPHLIISYLVASTILDKENNGLTWMALILLSSFIIHLLFGLMKLWIVQLKQRKNILWMPLFILALLYSTIFPTWIVWDVVTPYVQELAGSESEWFIIGPLFIFLTYFHTHFLHRSTWSQF